MINSSIRLHDLMTLTRQERLLAELERQASSGARNDEDASLSNVQDVGFVRVENGSSQIRFILHH